MNNQSKLKVLFLCIGNSARSQMAEVLLRHKASDQFEVFSAGTQPESVDKRALAALESFGLPKQQLRSKGLEEFEGQTFDYVITLCDKSNQECRTFPGAVNQLAWDFPDPKTRGGNIPFVTTLNEINTRIAMFILVAQTSSHQQNELKKNASLPELEPIAFYKCLTDEVRLQTLMLTHYHGELCVCELMVALGEESQPKVSRNLAVLKKSNVIIDRKHGKWVFYRIDPSLPLWAKSVIAQTTENNISLISAQVDRLAHMKNRPDKTSFC